MSSPASAPNPEKVSGHFAVLLLIALALAIYLGTAAEPPLVDESDCGHAIAAREIRERGDPTVLHINGIRYLEKSPLHYWMVAASYVLAGETAFSTRLPAALATAGLALMLYVFGREFFGRRAGLYAGLVMCTSLGTYIFTRTMIPEAIYALEFTAAFYLFLRAWTGRLGPRAGYWGCAALIGLATLTRSLIGVVLPLGVLGMFWILTGGGRRWREIPFVSSVLVFLAVAAPWHVLASLRTPGFFQFYFFNEHALRALGWRYPQDYASVPLLVWWASHLAWLFPWSVFLWLAARELPRASQWRTDTSAPARARVFLLAWAGFILLFFSFTKRMEYYAFGAWPAIALLLGLGLARAEEAGDRWLLRLQAALGVLGVGIAAILGALLWVSRHISGRDDIVGLLEAKPAEFYKVAMANFFDLTPQAFAALRIPAGGAALLLAIGLGVAWKLRRGQRHLAANVAIALTAAGFLFCANLAFRAFEPRLSSRMLAQEINKELRPGDQIVLYGDFYNGCTISFYTRRKTRIYNGRYHALEFGSNYPDAPRIFLTDADFPKLWGGPDRAFLFVPQHKRRELLVRLPLDSTYVLAESGGKAVYVNRPLRPDQPTLAELGMRPAGPGSEGPRDP